VPEEDTQTSHGRPDLSVAGPTSERRVRPVPSPWQASIALWRDAMVVRRVLTVIAVAVGAVWLFVIVLTGMDGELGITSFWSFTKVFLFVLAGLLVVTYLVMALLYRRYEYRFVLDEEGATAASAGGTRKKDIFINRLLRLTGRPSAMGAGVLAGSRGVQRARWRDLDSFRVNAEQHQIFLKRGRRVIMLLQCTDENHEAVCRFVRDRVRRRGS